MTTKYAPHYPSATLESPSASPGDRKPTKPAHEWHTAATREHKRCKTAHRHDSIARI